MSGILKPCRLLMHCFSTCCAVCGFPLYLAGVQQLHAAGRSSFWQCLQILGVLLSLWAVVYRGFWPLSHMTGPFVPEPETASQTNWKLQILEIFNPHKSWLFVLCSGVPGALVLGMFSAWLISLQLCLLLVTAGCFFFLIWATLYMQNVISCLGGVYGSIFCIFLCSNGQTLKYLLEATECLCSPWSRNICGMNPKGWGAFSDDLSPG